MPLERSALPKKDFCSMGMTQHRDSGGCSFSSLPRATSPRLSLRSLVHSAISLPEPRVSGCKWNFVCWIFKRFSESPAFAPWQTETPVFHRHMLLGFPSRFWYYRLESPAWVLNPTLIRGNTLAPEISLQNFSHCPRSPASFLVLPLHSLPVTLW